MRTTLAILMIGAISLHGAEEWYGREMNQRVRIANQTIIRYEKWGQAGEKSIHSIQVPQGEVWVVRAGSISGGGGGWAEYSLSIWAEFQGHTPKEQLLSPIATSKSNDTPQLAIDRPVILLPGEALHARANSLPANLAISIRFSAWVFPQSMLPQLLQDLK